jgi:hypothetical protein
MTIIDKNYYIWSDSLVDQDNDRVPRTSVTTHNQLKNTTIIDKNYSIWSDSLVNQDNDRVPIRQLAQL